jgi:hypothetical protein
MSEIELLTFPCDIAVKVIGAGDAPMEELVLEIVRRHVNESEIGPVQIRNSRNGRYQAVTVSVQAENRVQLDAIYEALSAHDKVVMAL